MIFKTIKITEGLFSKTFNFSDKVNLIYSSQNTKGKTTLLRFLLYSLGYNVPNTRKFKFEQCSVELKFYSEKCGEISISRSANSHLTATINNERITYILPEQLTTFHEILFGTTNTNILDNLLGAFYVDQEKGWTLLNRGVVIGSIHFNIESLIRGLSNRDCSSLIFKEKSLVLELSKYRQMFSVAKYKETIELTSGSVAITPHEEETNLELEKLLIQQNELKKEIRRLDHTIGDNKRFKKFISEMKLLIQSPDGNTIPVTIDNIIGYNDNFNYLIAKHKLISSKLSYITNQIERLEREKNTDEIQQSFWNTETLIESFEKKLSTLQINSVIIEKEINRIENELKKIRQTITEKTKFNNETVNRLYNIVLKYAVELGIGDNKSLAASYLFTSNLKELSGAILHKTVFAFRLAYIIEIEKYLNIKLPIILDSPSGKEIDHNNIQLMINILKRDFSDHQIIIASIFNYDFDTVNEIEIKDRLIE